MDKTKQKVSFFSVALLVALVLGYFFFQNKINELESQLDSINLQDVATVASVVKKDVATVASVVKKDVATVASVVKKDVATVASVVKKDLATVENTEDSSSISASTDSLESQLDDLNNQLITARSELHSVQQKLIISTSKTQILEDEIAQMKDARTKIDAIKYELEDTKNQLTTKSIAVQAAQEKYDNLANSLAEQNLRVVIRNTNRIDMLEETIGASSITAAIVPLLSVATLIDYIHNEINNYCSDIEEIINLEQNSLIETRLTNNNNSIIKKFEKQCR